MRQHLVFAIVTMTITMILTDSSISPGECLHKYSKCGLSSKPCCPRNLGNRSSLVIKRYCDYFGSRSCVTPDKMCRYEDSRHIEELKYDEDFQRDYNNYLVALENIQRHLDSKYFMDRMLSTEPMRKMSNLDKLS